MAILRRVTAILACLPALAVHGQQGQVSGPVAGYVFDGAALRVISGVPGGATLGDSINLGIAATAAVISPQLDSAIVTANDGSLHLFRLGQSATEILWNGLPQGPARVVYSPSGSAAAICVSGRVKVVGGLPGAPVATFTVELDALRDTVEVNLSAARPPSPWPSAEPQAMAVSDDAAWLLTGGDGRVRLLGASGLYASMGYAARNLGAAFAPGSHAYGVLDGTTGRLDVYPNLSGSAAYFPQIIPAPGLAEPVGLAFSVDGKSALAASRTAKSVTIFDLAAGTATTLDCDCIPTGVSRMGKFFRLTEAGAGPVWMVDAATNPARIVFVPARANP